MGEFQGGLLWVEYKEGHFPHTQHQGWDQRYKENQMACSDTNKRVQVVIGASTQQISPEALAG
eukprot:4837772-Prorocentrum_lima.AAC.1